MPFVRALPNQFLLVGRGGNLVNRGSAVQVFLWPGTVHVLVPSTKQEASFEFSQETRDGIPLRFKGIVVYRITDPIAAARAFELRRGAETSQINALLTHICLGELRHAVSHMTMSECIEQRKTTLSGVIRQALDATVHPDEADAWGLTIEVAQVAQVFIVDAELRHQLESEVRNEIRLRSGQSDVRTDEELELAATLSRDRLADQRLTSDQEGLRRSQALFAAEMEAQQARIEAEAPVRLLQAERDQEVLARELESQELRNRVHRLEVAHDLEQARAQQALRLELLPVEQVPQLVEAAAGVFRGADLTVYGDDGGLVRQVAPLMDVAARAVERALTASSSRSDRTDATE